jgi:hypothetical protein
MTLSGPWSSEEDALLHELATSGETLATIAKHLDRSAGAVRMRASRLTIELAKSGKLTNCPAWLKLSEDRTYFVLLPDRADVVRKIFALSAGGLGGYTIANQLNASGVPAFGPSDIWDQSTIHNMLTNRATIGEHQPKIYESAKGRPAVQRDRKGLPVGDVVPNYYPAVVDEDLFNRAQQARRENLVSRRGRKGSLITNLFGGIPTCAYCDAPVKFHSNGSAKSLICSTVLAQRGCYRMGWSYQSFENSFFKLVAELDLQATANENERDKLAELKTLVAATSGLNVYDARLSLSLALRAAVSELNMAAAGDKPVAGDPKSHIRRDGPHRFFQVRFFNGSSYVVSSAGK